MTEEEKIERVARAILRANGAQITTSDAEWPLMIGHYRKMEKEHGEAYTSARSLVTDAMRNARVAITALEGLSRIQKEGGGSAEGGSAPSPSGNNGWRPIAEAPKDGTPILIARHNDMFGWVRGWTTWVNIKGISGWISRGFFTVPGELGLAHPTHWQPLPSPPIPDTEKGPSHHVASAFDHVRDASNMIKGIDPELQAFLDKAREWDAKATPEEREAMMKAQRESYVRAELAFGDDADEAEYRRRMDAGLPLHDTPSGAPETEKNDG